MSIVNCYTFYFLYEVSFSFIEKTTFIFLSRNDLNNSLIVPSSFIGQSMKILMASSIALRRFLNTILLLVNYFSAFLERFPINNLNSKFSEIFCFRINDILTYFFIFFTKDLRTKILLIFFLSTASLTNYKVTKNAEIESLKCHGIRFSFNSIPRFPSGNNLRPHLPQNYVIFFIMFFFVGRSILTAVTKLCCY